MTSIASPHILIPTSPYERWTKWFADTCRLAEPVAQRDTPYVFAHKWKIWDRVEREIDRIRLWQAVDAPVRFGVHRLILTKDGDRQHDLGPVSFMKISTSFTEREVDAMQNSTTTPLDVYAFHTYGSSNTIDVNTQNALVAEFAAATWTAANRPGSNQGEGATANIYQAAQNTPLTVASGQGPISVEEVGVFLSQTFLAVGMIDRGLTGTITRNNNEGVQNTFEYTSLPEP